MDKISAGAGDRGIAADKKVPVGYVHGEQEKESGEKGQGGIAADYKVPVGYVRSERVEGEGKCVSGMKGRRVPADILSSGSKNM